MISGIEPGLTISHNEVYATEVQPTHLAENSGVEPTAVKAILAALEATTLASMNKKVIGEFTLPGLLKVIVQKVPARVMVQAMSCFLCKWEQIGLELTVSVHSPALPLLK